MEKPIKLSWRINPVQWATDKQFSRLLEFFNRHGEIGCENLLAPSVRAGSVCEYHGNSSQDEFVFPGGTNLFKMREDTTQTVHRGQWRSLI